MGELRGERLRCERLVDPLAVAAATPRLSWIAAPAGDGARAGRGMRQTSYRVRAAATRAALLAGEQLIWDSGRVVSGDALAVAWGGRPLAPGERVVWDVTLWDQHGEAGPRSVPASFAAAIDDWGGAQWIGDGHPWAEHTPASGAELDP
ncbi:MAG TPA: alpha-L-rhamnosidase, partial [Conexibacter sp.]|nr:alpha-L-rhamnosidase [Conexibacter sp.]